MVNTASLRRVYGKVHATQQTNGLRSDALSSASGALTPRTDGNTHSLNLTTVKLAEPRRLMWQPA